jgi:hypothetical protein
MITSWSPTPVAPLPDLGFDHPATAAPAPWRPDPSPLDPPAWAFDDPAPARTEAEVAVFTTQEPADPWGPAPAMPDSLFRDQHAATAKAAKSSVAEADEDRVISTAADNPPRSIKRERRAIIILASLVGLLVGIVAISILVLTL